MLTARHARSRQIHKLQTSSALYCRAIYIPLKRILDMHR
jgi:hypothetical protein